jgi:DNA-binding response OmpR family regulator
MTPSPQKVLDRLKEADGPVDQWELVKVIDPRPTTAQTTTLRSYVRRIRAEIGYDCIRNVWGRGYLLTETGRRVLSEKETRT